jgi:hypothetical protein
MDDDAAVPADDPRPIEFQSPSAPDAFDEQLEDWNLDAASAPDEPYVAYATGVDEPDEVRTTEWFSLEEDLEDEEPLPALPRRNHHVTAVVVSHDGSVWLTAVLTTLAAQTRPIDAGIGVDTGSVDRSEGLLAESFGPDRALVLDHRVGFGDAVRAGLESLERPVHEPFTPEFVEWVWLLHDDSAPDVRCLEALLDTADDNPSAAVLGPKILGWHDRRLLLEAGVTVTGSGRRVTNLDKREHDQGQKDGVRDVLAVSSMASTRPCRCSATTWTSAGAPTALASGSSSPPTPCCTTARRPLMDAALMTSRPGRTGPTARRPCTSCWRSHPRSPVRSSRCACSSGH